VLLGALLSQAAACTRFQVHRSNAALADPAAPAAVALRAFANDRGRAAGEPFHGQVQVELSRRDGAHWELVHRGNADALAAAEVTGGTWRLRVTGVQVGDRLVPPAGRQDRVFSVQPGQTAHIDLTVRSVPWEAILVVTVVVAVVVVAVVVVAVVAVGSQGGGGGGGGGGFADLWNALTPPAKGPGAGVPIGPPGGAVLHLDGSGGPLLPLVWVDTAPFDPTVWDDPEADDPHIRRIVPPAPDEPAGAVRVEFDRRMDPATFDPAAIALTGANGDVTAGLWSPDRGRTAVLQPLRPLAPGAYTVVVDGSRVRTRKGAPLEHGAAVLFSIGATGSVVSPAGAAISR
jgi:hypothetical protein